MRRAAEVDPGAGQDSTDDDASRASKILVLPTATASKTLAVTARILRRHPGAEVVVIATDASRASLERGGGGFRVARLPWGRVDGDALRAAVAGEAFERVVVPLGLPQDPVLPAAGFVRSLSSEQVELDCEPLFSLRGRAVAWLALVAYALACFAPWRLMLHAAHFVDALLVLALMVVARGVRRLRRSPSPRGAGAVLHVITLLRFGGAQRQLAEYLRGTEGGGDAVTVVVLYDYDPVLVESLRPLRCTVELLADSYRRSAMTKALRLVFPRTYPLCVLWRLLVATRPRCTFQWLFLANTIGSCAARLAGVPMVCSSIRNLGAWKTWSDVRRWSWWMRLADRLSAPLNDVIVGNSRAVVEDYVAWSRIDPEVMRVVYNGVDPGRFVDAPYHDLRGAFGLSAQTPVLLTVGRLTAQKNLSMLLRCCGALRERRVDHRLVVVGEGEHESQLRRLCQELQIADRVHFVGTTAEPQSYYRAADVFVLPSHFEGMPNVILEAMVFGLPVVTTNWGGADELVKDGESGLVVAIDDDRAMTAALERLLADAELRLALGERAATRVRECFGLGRMVREIDQITGRRRG